MSDIIDESNQDEAYEDPYGDADKDETLPELRQEETGQKSVHQRMAMSNKKMPLHVETARERYEAAIFKHDILRKKYDIRRNHKR